MNDDPWAVYTQGIGSGTHYPQDSVHVAPTADPRRKHVRDGGECWCDPRVEYIDEKTGTPLEAPLVVHHAPPGYPGREEDE